MVMIVGVVVLEPSEDCGSCEDTEVTMKGSTSSVNILSAEILA